MTGRFAPVIWKFLSALAQRPFSSPAPNSRRRSERSQTKLSTPSCPRQYFSGRFGVLTLFSIHLTNHFNNFNFPFNGGYLTAGSNQLGVFITAF
jgi:hypothetical protein